MSLPRERSSAQSGEEKGSFQSHASGPSKGHALQGRSLVPFKHGLKELVIGQLKLLPSGVNSANINDIFHYLQGEMDGVLRSTHSELLTRDESPASPEEDVADAEPMEVSSIGARRPRSPSEDDEDSEPRSGASSPSFADMAKRPKRVAASPPAVPPRNAASAAAAAAAASATATTAAATTSAAAAAAAAAKATARRQRYPPLIVEELRNWEHHLHVLKRKLGHAPNAKSFGNKGFKFIPKSEEEYRLVQRYLTQVEKEENISWFSYSLPAEKSVKVAIKGLPLDTSVEAIQLELEGLGFTPEYIRPIKARNGRPGCIYLAILKRTANIAEIYKVSELLSLPTVKIELWRGKKGPAQCHRCQQFRHSSHNCHRRLACVKCGDEHTARDCPRQKEDPPTCANCKGAHTANNPNCPVIRREARNKRAGAVALTTVHNVRPKDTPASATTLMAEANNPTEKSQLRKKQPKKKRKNKKKNKKKQPAPPTASTTRPQPLPASAPSADKGGDRKKRTPQKQGSSDEPTIPLRVFHEFTLDIMRAHQTGEDLGVVIHRHYSRIYGSP